MRFKKGDIILQVDSDVKKTCILEVMGKAKKNKAIAKNLFLLILPEGIGLSGWATESISASVISFQISAAKNPAYKVIIVKIITLIISSLIVLPL